MIISVNAAYFSHYQPTKVLLSNEQRTSVHSQCEKLTEVTCLCSFTTTIPTLKCFFLLLVVQHICQGWL